MHIPPSAKLAKSELAAVTGRLAGAGIPETAIRRALALIRSGREDLLARVIAGELDLERAWRIARSARHSALKF